MSDKKIIFIDDSKSFITKSIMNNVIKAKHDCELIEMSVNAIEHVKNSIGGYVIYNIGSVDSVNQMALTYLRDVCLELDCIVVFMGYSEDIEAVRGDLFNAEMCREFYRPLNAQDIAEKIVEMVEGSPEGMGKKHVLVVDDSGTMLTTIQTWLSGKYRVSVVNSAVNAFTFLARQVPDLILLDYEMPVCSGAKFLEMLRENTETQNIPVIFLTGKGDAESVKSVLALKPAGYLLKTMPKEHIIGEIDAFFERSKM